MNVALVGCGVALPHHMLGLERVKSARVIAACDTIESAARAAADRCGIQKTYRDFGEMIEKERPDVVHVMTPPATHRDIAVRALGAGCHVLLEKPMALNVAECDQIIRARDESGRMLCMMHNHLFDPNVVPWRDVGAVERVTGPLRLVQVTYCLDSEKIRHEGQHDPAHWVHALPLDVFSEYCPHLLYLALNWIGEVREASLVRLERPGPLPTAQNAFHVGLVGSSAVGSVTMLDQTDYGHFMIDLHGLRGVLHLNMMDLTAVAEVEPNFERRLNKMMKASLTGTRMVGANIANAVRIVLGLLRPRPGHRALIAAFYDALANGTPAPVSGEDGREVIRVHEILCGAAAGAPGKLER